MELLIFWLGTSIASVGMELANEFRMLKDVADAGYKIDIIRLSELGKQLNPNASKTTLLSMIIPVFNIMKVLENTIQYNNIRPMILDQLNIINVLEEMSEREKQEYLKNPTGLNALLIPLKLEKELEDAFVCNINPENENDKIYYKFGPLLIHDIIILKTTGAASRLTIEEQKKKIIDFWNARWVDFNSKKDFDNDLKRDFEYGFEDDLKRDFEYGYDDELISNKNLNSTDNQENKKDLSISERKQILKNFKHKLLEQQKSDTKDDQDLTKTKK